MEKPKLTYQKGNVYNHTNNDKFMIVDEYKPREVTEKVFNPVTEQYEYKSKMVNDKLDWENELELKKELLEMENK